MRSQTTNGVVKVPRHVVVRRAPGGAIESVATRPGKWMLFEDAKPVFPGAAPRPMAPIHDLLRSPASARLRALSIDGVFDGLGNHYSEVSHNDLIDALVSRVRPRLQCLELSPSLLARDSRLGLRTPHLSHLTFNWCGVDTTVACGALARVWSRAPALELFALPQPAPEQRLGLTRAAHLRTLVYGAVAPAQLREIADAQLPALDTLVVRVPARKDGKQVRADVGRLLAAPFAPRLRALGLIGDAGDLDRGAAILEALLVRPPGAVVDLDLGGVTARPAAWRTWLKRAGAAFPKLRALHLSTWTDAERAEFRLREDAVGRALAAAFPVRWLTTSYGPEDPDDTPYLIRSRDAAPFYGFASGAAFGWSGSAVCLEARE